MSGWIRQTRDLLEEMFLRRHREGAGIAITPPCRFDPNK